MVDMAAQIASVLGVEIDFSVTKLDAIIPGIESGRLDLAGPTGDFVERQERVDFTDVAQSVTTVLVQTEGDFQPTVMLDLCGVKVSVEKGAGTTTTINAISDVCEENGKDRVDTQTYPDQAAAILALGSGRVTARLNPTASNAIAAATSDGKLSMISIEEIFALPAGGATYGIQSKKGSEMAKVIEGALHLLYEEGVYTKLFEQWLIPESAIPLDRIAVNGSTQRQKG